MAWTLRFDPRALKDLQRLDRPVQPRILRYLEERVAAADDPELQGKPLRGFLRGLHRYRVDDYRIVCLLDRAELVVLVLAAGHRRHVYEDDALER